MLGASEAVQSVQSLVRMCKKCLKRQHIELQLHSFISCSFAVKGTQKNQVSNQIAANGGCSLKGHGSGCTGHLANWSDLAPEDDERTGSARRSRGYRDKAFGHVKRCEKHVLFCV